MIWTEQRPLTGRAVLFTLFGFFGVIMTVNAVFVFFALTSWSGLSTEDSYRKGLAYNDNLSAADTQTAMAWNVTVQLDALADKKGRLKVAFLNKNGAAIDGLAVNGILTRPTQPDLDQTITLGRIDAGVYSADVEFPLNGVWNLTVIARRDKTIIYRIEQRLWREPQK
ncbi:MAG: FixH family protein [Alphaproteobacteria bacterium]|nr:FixH family protein [Alphaproteobacteria bacterium]